MSQKIQLLSHYTPMKRLEAMDSKGLNLNSYLMYFKMFYTN